MKYKSRDNKIAEQKNTPYLDKPKKALLDLKSQGEGKARCSNCGKIYNIIGKPKFTDMLGYLAINNCSQMYNMKKCKGAKS
tara:strand:+ start:75 stop:317 length:243 start_codon:yes stop_codon:yes gene_type:complete